MNPRSTPIVYGLVVLAIGAGLFYFIGLNTIGPREVAGSFLAMIGTFLGAFLAFRLNLHRDDLARDKERKSALNRALFILARQRNAVLAITKHLAPFETEFDRAFVCPAFTPPSYEDLVLDFSEIDFLLDFHEPSVLLDLSIEEEGFRQVFESLRLRNSFYVGEVQPAIAQLGLNERPMTKAEFERSLGERLYKSAINYAGAVYTLTSEALSGIQKVHNELFTVAKRAYPDAKFVKLEGE